MFMIVVPLSAIFVDVRRINVHDGLGLATEELVAVPFYIKVQENFVIEKEIEEIRVRT